MASEIKKRLLLSKWRCQVDALQGTLRTSAEQIATLRGELEDALHKVGETNEDLEELRGQIEARDSVQDETLLAVKYWMLGVLVHHRPMSDPRVILRKVEEALQ